MTIVQWEMAGRSYVWGIDPYSSGRSHDPDRKAFPPSPLHADPCNVGATFGSGATDDVTRRDATRLVFLHIVKFLPNDNKSNHYVVFFASPRRTDSSYLTRIPRRSSTTHRQSAHRRRHSQDRDASFSVAAGIIDDISSHNAYRIGIAFGNFFLSLL